MKHGALVSKEHGIFLLAFGLCLIVLGGSACAQVPEPIAKVAPKVTKPINPPGTGFVPPDVDLSHLEPTLAKRAKELTVMQPAAFDWRTTGKVTSVTNQSSCGSCYAFASIGCFESKILIDTSATYNLSENHAKECYYTSPSCAGGNFYQTACLFSQTGTQLETDNPYVAAVDTCNTGPSYPYQQTLLDWCIITGAAVPTTNVLKNYIMNNGPVYASLYVGLGPIAYPPSGTPWYIEFSGYNGGLGLGNRLETGTVNHAVLIVGWDDTKQYDLHPRDGSPDGIGCWIIKNSWGSNLTGGGWGETCGFGTETGYFYIDYGSADVGQYSSFIDGWQNYDSNGSIEYFDEAGWGSLVWGYSSTTCWGLCRYTITGDTKATAIEFWTNDSTTDVDVYLYDSFNTSTGTLGALLTSSLNNSFSEPGYHSVSITPTDIGPGSHSEAVAVVKITNTFGISPIQADFGNGAPVETQRCYISPSGVDGSWYQTSTDATYPSDICVRLRTSTATAIDNWTTY